MSLKKLLLGSLFVGGGLAVSRLWSARTASEIPVFTGKVYTDMDDYLEAQMRRLGIPGASLAVVEGDRLVHYRGFGKARPGGETPTLQTPFFIGSVTKSFTALAVMQLVEAGKIELDAPVQRYLPWFRVADPEASARMTVRQLLNQTSGMPMWPSETDLQDFNHTTDATERHVRALATLKLHHPPVEEAEYSNFNFNILGLIVEKVSGETYDGYIQKHVFDPLEMHRSYSSRAAAQAEGLAVGYRHWFGCPIPAPDMPIPAGALPSGWLISCAEDMAHYLIAQLNGGRYGKVQILSSDGIDTMHRGEAVIARWQGSVIKYGMGWFDSDLGQTKIYSHGGNLPNFSAYISMVPGQKRGVVALFNADPYGLPMITDEVGTGLTALLAGQSPPPKSLDFIPWIFRLLPLIPLLQVMGVLTTLRSVKRWNRHPSIRPGPMRMWGQQILLPLIPNLSMAGLLLYIRSSGMIRFLHFFMPDLAWIFRISGSFAAIWALLHTRLVLKTLHKPRHLAT